MSEHEHIEPAAPRRTPKLPPDTNINPVDAGSQALAEALRSSFLIVRFVMFLLVLVFLGSGFFIVGPQERAIKLRFGKPVGEGENALLLPGLHWSFPYPIDEYVKVPFSGLQRVVSSVGWYKITPEEELAGTEPYVNSVLTPGMDGYLLTADGNIFHARATLTYRISDPIAYVFSFVNASNAVLNALDSALLRVASRYQVDDALTRDIAGFNEAVRRRVDELAADRNLGIVIEQCSVKSIPPRQLKDAFDNVLKAEVLRTKALTEARSYENQVLSRAIADAESRINTARSDRARLVADVSSRASQFEKLLPQYRAYPTLFVQQRLAETLGRALTNVQDKVFVPESTGGKTREMRYLINREPRARTPQQPRP